MSHFDQEIVDFVKQELVRGSQAAIQVKQFQAPRLTLSQRILFNAGDILISLGLKIKNLSRPVNDQEYTPLYT